MQVDLKSQVESFKASLETRERELVTCQRELERLRAEHSSTVAATREAEAASTRSRDALERQVSCVFVYVCGCFVLTTQVRTKGVMCEEGKNHSCGIHCMHLLLVS